jgi:Ca-activated chloride channel family protein
VGIIAFAGSNVVRCPLTTDYSFARLSLDNLSPDAVARGGTFIGDAIRVALDQIFTDGDDRFRDIILITDGDDQESKPVDAAKIAGARGIRIIAIGLGSELEGAMVPIDTANNNGKPEYMTYEGSTVRSKLDSGSLRAIAEASKDGVFLNVGTGNIQMDKVYRTLAERAERREVDSSERVKYDELFQYALGLSAAMLVMHSLMGQRRRHGL